MGLKQSVVVVNEYTVKTGAKSGSRGGTPGDYVRRYMARNLATEDVTPVRLSDADTYIMKYMARKTAAEILDNVSQIKDSMWEAQRYGGVAFGYGDVALSDEGLKAASQDIQKQFDDGKTVMKTVLSFDLDYLKKHGIVDPSFEPGKPGDFRGNIDQLKLRLGIMHGIARMGRHYDDLQYVGVIQVDTMHVHCHLAMVDRGKGHIMSDGTQRGKINEKEKADLRRGVDMWLDEKQTVKMMSSSVMYDKRNALCYIKRFAHKTMSEHGFSQFLMACLPDNKNWWRAGTNRKEMRKANALVREYVTNLLSQPNSGYREAMDSVVNYAEYRRRNEDLGDQDYQKLVRAGQEKIITDCMNGVYAVVRQVPDAQKVIHTPMLEAMSQDYEDMAAKAVDDPMVEFGFRLRSYASRMDFHRKECHKYRDLVHAYESASDKEDASKPLGDFFQFEAQYQAMLMAKYQNFLSFLPADEDFEEEFLELAQMQKKLDNLRAMRDDASLRRMQPDAAEDYALKVYGQRGGRRVKDHPDIIAARVVHFAEALSERQREFKERLQDYGMTYDGHGILRQLAYDFDDVKALDLHHMGYDFPYDVKVSKRNIDNFIQAANARKDLLDKAAEYLVLSGQESELSELPVSDVEFMKKYADQFGIGGVLKAERPASGQFKRSNTVRISKQYEIDMKLAVESVVRGVQLGDM